jgi:hypothetical protein
MPRRHLASGHIGKRGGTHTVSQLTILKIVHTEQESVSSLDSPPVASLLMRIPDELLCAGQDGHQHRAIKAAGYFVVLFRILSDGSP